MIIEEISASYSRKYGLPEYSSFDVFIGTKAKVESFDLSADDLSASLLRTCKLAVESFGNETLRHYYEDNNERFWMNSDCLWIHRQEGERFSNRYENNQKKS